MKSFHIAYLNPSTGDVNITVMKHIAGDTDMVVVDSTTEKNHVYRDGCPRFYLSHKEGYGWVGIDLLWVKPEEVDKIQSRILPGGTKVLAKI